MNFDETVDIPQQVFALPDYISFAVMFLMCIVIGVYFGFFHKPKNVDDYLVGGRSMSVMPVAISLVVSYISGISFLGTPTEIYIYGMQFSYALLSPLVMGFFATKTLLPIFIELQVTSSYEYLELRYDPSLRRYGSFAFIISVLLWLPIVVYVPSMAFSHATGVNIHITTPIVCIICIFYTCVGGIRAVIWTDFIQAFIMVGSLILVIIKGTIDVGGLAVVIDRNLNSTRLEAPDLDLSPFTRNTFWGLVIGGGINFLQSGIISQVMMQRYVSLPSLKAAEMAMWAFCVLKTVFFLMCTFTGLLIYAVYHDCDPITTKVVKAQDQLLPLLVIKTLGGIPGLAGLFLSGIFSASLSSLSSGLNSLSAVLLEDCYKPMFKKVSARHAAIVAKLSVVIVGGITVLLAFIVEKLGPVLQLSIMMGSVCNGPLLGVFLMGALLPCVNSRGAMYGGLLAMCVMGWISFNAQAAIASGSISYPRKPISTDGCDFNFTLSANITQPVTEDVFPVFRLSYLWYTTTGTLLATIFGLIVSFATGCNKDRDIDPVLLAPFLRKYMKPKNSIKLQSDIKMPEEIDLLQKPTGGKTS